MKILLVSTNFDNAANNKNINLGISPIGLAYISYPLKQIGYNVDIFDAAQSNKPDEEFNLKLDSFCPDIVGFSIRNIDNQSMLDYHTPLPKVRKFVANVVNRNITSVLGGIGYSVFPEQLLEEMNADYGISGQGEKSFPELIKCIYEGKNEFDHIAGLCYRKEGKIVLNTPDNSGYRNVKYDLNLFNFNNYKSELWTGMIVTKTGCPYNCTFCDTPRLAHKFQSIGHNEIIDKIKLLQKIQKINSFYFSDNCFASPINNTKELLYKIIKADLNISIFAQITSRKNCFDDEFYELYKKAGGKATYIGADSFSETMLKSYNNGFTLNSIYENIKLAEKYKITASFCWLIGGPGENLGTIKESINFLKTVKYRNLLTHFGIRILPGAPLRKIAIDEGIITKDTNLLPPIFYFSKLVSVNDAKKYIESNLKLTPI
ncbi:MAG: radical SAM protein [bacterium]|nr:radical SAM protein [bacterium]